MFARALFLLALGTGSILAADWPGWRGPSGMGQSDDKGLPLTWGGKDNTNVRWKVPLPGQDMKAAQDQNQSSPIVAGDKVIVITYADYDEAELEGFQPAIVHVDEHNEVVAELHAVN